ncbi:hypothetical protein J1N35_040750 [Gossypium stocksii]|uniref:Retroviral polymerase SH3-like domain-containing protein n=1 Tax=Gossypium stocksii TaxID=47602 RepID=A0A9D3UEJ9_9ROSI|nr:hypothetical protein J1N35_040750 [Gossypium stocksii]
MSIIDFLFGKQLRLPFPVNKAWRATESYIYLTLIFKPSMSQLKIFGCLCYALILDVKRNKLERRTQVGIFVGYSSCKKGYRIFYPFTSKVFESKDVKLNEEALWN